MNKIVDSINELKVVELLQLVSDLEEKWGVSAAAPVAAAAAGAVEAEEEQSEYDVVVESAGSNKIATIKAIRAITGLGLKEAKEKADAGGSLGKFSKEDAKKHEASLKEAGAQVSLK